MSKREILGAMLAMILADQSQSRPVFDELKMPNPEKDSAQIKQEIALAKKAKEDSRKKKCGLTEFFYGQESVWALSKDRADKKARKRGLI